MRLRALTLHQPYATLVALGIKTIETRSRPMRTLVGERIAIHAAARGWGINSAMAEVVRSFPRETYSRLRGALGVDIEEARPLPASLGHRSPARPGWPLGAVVCTAVVTDCVPFEDLDAPNDEVPTLDAPTVIYVRPSSPGNEDFGLLTCRHEHPPIDTDVSDQLPYGDFRPGRWGLLLADVEPLAEPIPARGQQGVWWWEP